jgi:hypothetical protein
MEYQAPLSQAVRDFRGSVIMVGSSVVYPTRRGSSMQMIAGVVEGIETGPSNHGTTVTVSRRRESSTYAAGHADFSYLDGRPVKVDVSRIVVVS